MAKTLDAAGVKRLIQEIKGANKNLNAPIPISTENTTESMAQNVKNIADYVEKAKAAGVANVNGMAVTCLIDGENSGVGYLYVTNTQVLICGILAYEDNSVSCISVIDGTYSESSIVVEGHIGQITSDMLAQGARNPIVITGDMTEVDEETYQKLLQEGTDVILSLGDNGSFIGLQGIFNTGDTLILMFGYSDFDESDNGTIVTYAISINTSAPHTLTFAATGACNPVPKSELISVLQEIDLRGTDADRKAKLDQFEADWKALTGADDLTGARFVGKFGITDDVERNVTGIMTYSAGDTATEKNDDCFYGICNGYSFSKQKSQIAVKVSCTDGSLTITPLFSHLEAITIYTDNTPEHMQANLDNIAAYKANLQALGVDMNIGFLVPISCGNLHGYVISRNPVQNSPYVGYISNETTIEDCKNVLIQSTTGQVYTYTLGLKKDVDKKVDKSLNAKSLEAVTIRIGNTPEDKAANVAAIKAYADNLKALGVDVTKGYMIPITASGRNGFLSTRSGNYPYAGYVSSDSSVNDFYNILILGNGEYYDSKIQLENSSELNTISKQIVGAINEINANAVHSDKFVPTLEAITIKTGNTPEGKAANVAAIKAYVDNLKALGVDVTKGYMIPCKFDNSRNGFIMQEVAGNYAGFIKDAGTYYGGGFVSVTTDGTYRPLEILSTAGYNVLTTNSKYILNAINEVNALAKGYSTIFTPIELTTETAQNKTTIDARVAAFTAQGISLANGCCIPVTYKGVYAGNISLINGDWYGLLVKNTNNPADNINIKLSADGTITEGNSAQ